MLLRMETCTARYEEIEKNGSHAMFRLGSRNLMKTFWRQNEQPSSLFFFQVCHKAVTAPDRPQIITDTGSIQAEDEKEGCPRCGGKVTYSHEYSAKSQHPHLNSAIWRNIESDH